MGVEPRKVVGELVGGGGGGWRDDVRQDGIGRQCHAQPMD